MTPFLSVLCAILGSLLMATFMEMTPLVKAQTKQARWKLDTGNSTFEVTAIQRNGKCIYVARANGAVAIATAVDTYKEGC